MKYVQLGTTDLQISAVALGCLSLTPEKEEASRDYEDERDETRSQTFKDLHNYLFSNSLYKCTLHSITVQPLPMQEDTDLNMLFQRKYVKKV